MKQQMAMSARKQEELKKTVSEEQSKIDQLLQKKGRKGNRDV